MSKGTIVYIGGFELPDKNAAAHRVINNAKIFKDIGYNIVFIDSNREVSWKNDEFEKSKNYYGFECWSKPTPKNKLTILQSLFSIKKENEIISKYNDVKMIILYNYPAFSMLRLIKKYRKHKIKLIGDVTEWYGTQNKSFLFKIVKGLDTFIRMNIIHKKLDGLIVISKFLENFYNKNNVIYLPPLIDINENKWNKDDIIKKDYSFVYAGSPSSEKERLDLIIESFMKLYEKYKPKLTIIGINKDQFISIYPNYNLEKYPETFNRVTFLGRVDHIQALKYVKEASFSFIIRDDNRVTRAGFPTKFVESITCNTAVISTDNSDLKFYIRDNDNGYIVDKDNLYTELEYILKKPIPNKISNDIFHYEKYVDTTYKFIQRLEGKRNEEKKSNVTYYNA